MIGKDFTRKENQEYEKWLAEKAAVQRLDPLAGEKNIQKERRIKELKADFFKFACYYFEDYTTSGFGWFHKKAVKEVVKNPNIMLVAEWPREHAKSVLFDIMLPMYLLSTGELTGMMIGSANEAKANTLLSDVQAELMFNKRYIEDYGVQYRDGKWSDGYFVTASGVGFWAFGRGQSPRGTRNAENRPNYGVIDDIDDAAILRNRHRCKEAADWCLGDFFGAMSIKGGRLIVAGNRTGKASILSHIVGDIEPDDPKKPGITHIKVFALESPKTHQKNLSEAGVPAWKENYTRKHILDKMEKMGWRLGLREFFHEHAVEGDVFTEESLPWVKLPDISTYEALVTYCDPSFKGSKKNDFKGIVLMGRIGVYFDIIAAFCRQGLPPEMVRGHYALAARVPEHKVCKHWMEANFIQDILLEEYDREAERAGYHIGIRGDTRKKPEKASRIEALSSLTERRRLRFNIEEKGSPDMQELRDQFLGFPNAEHDDGPDCTEGAFDKLNKMKSGPGKYRTGKYKHNPKRRAY